MLIVLVHQVKTFADETRMRWTVGRVGSAERKRQRGGGYMDSTNAQSSNLPFFPHHGIVSIHQSINWMEGNGLDIEMNGWIK